MIFKKIILFFFSLFFVQVIIAQGGATIKATVNKNKILLGEPLVLTIEAFLTPESVNNFIVLDSIPHFELLEAPKVDSVYKEGGVIIKGVYTIASFDSGHWEIPSFTLSKGVKTDAIPIDVVFSDFNPEQDYHDIKDVLDVKTNKNKIAWWVYLVSLLGVIILIYLLARRKKKPVAVITHQVKVSPYDEAMNALSQLQMDKPEVKEYHSRLVNIFRIYVFKKKGVLSLQKTTDDLVVQLKSQQLDKMTFEKLSQSLRLSDFVKFAKYQSTNDDNDNSFEIIKKAISTLEQSE